MITGTTINIMSLIDDSVDGNRAKNGFCSIDFAKWRAKGRMPRRKPLIQAARFVCVDHDDDAGTHRGHVTVALGIVRPSSCATRTRGDWRRDHIDVVR